VLCDPGKGRSWSCLENPERVTDFVWYQTLSLGTIRANVRDFELVNGAERKEASMQLV